MNSTETTVVEFEYDHEGRIVRQTTTVKYVVEEIDGLD